MAIDAHVGRPEQQAAGSSFYAAMRVMPKPERAAMYAIYAFCRAVDDIADDGSQPRNTRRTKLDEWRYGIATLYHGAPVPLVAFLEQAVSRYGLRKADFLAVIDGMGMDVEEDICAPDLATLDLYCERVASAVGRLSIKVFGMDEEPGFRLAHDLGRALQLTNILRDIDEDAGLRRLYLPRELFAEASIPIGPPAETIASPAIDAVCRGVARLALQHYSAANAVLAKSPRGDLRAPRLMSAVYGSILDEMGKRGWSPPRQRVHVAKMRLLWLLLRYGLLA
jgi:phytoene synthase